MFKSMNICKLLPITVICCSSFAKDNSVFTENNSVFEETYSVVWDNKENKVYVKNQIDEFITELTEGTYGMSLIHEAFNDLTSTPTSTGLSGIIHSYKTSREANKPQLLALSRIEQKPTNVPKFKAILEKKIQKYFSSKEITKNEKAVKDFLDQLVTPNIKEINSQTIEKLIKRIKNEKDTTFSNYLSNIFQSTK